MLRTRLNLPGVSGGRRQGDAIPDLATEHCAATPDGRARGPRAALGEPEAHLSSPRPLGKAPKGLVLRLLRPTFRQQASNGAKGDRAALRVKGARAPLRPVGGASLSGEQQAEGVRRSGPPRVGRSCPWAVRSPHPRRLGLPRAAPLCRSIGKGPSCSRKGSRCKSVPSSSEKIALIIITDPVFPAWINSFHVSATSCFCKN